MAYASLTVVSSVLAFALVIGAPRLVFADEPTPSTAPTTEAAPATTPEAPVAPPSALPPLPAPSPAPIVVVVMPPAASSAPGSGVRPETDAARPAARPTTWYGYQTLAVDGLAAGMVALTMKTDSVPFVYAALATYGFGAPLVHLFHGSGAKFGADVGMRLGGPALAALTGGALGGLGGDVYGALAGAGIGMVAGAAAAMIVDYTVLSREPKAEERWDGKVRAAPTVAASATGASVGVGGSF